MLLGIYPHPPLSLIPLCRFPPTAFLRPPTPVPTSPPRPVSRSPFPPSRFIPSLRVLLSRTPPPLRHGVKGWTGQCNSRRHRRRIRAPVRASASGLPRRCTLFLLNPEGTEGSWSVSFLLFSTPASVHSTLVTNPTGDPSRHPLRVQRNSGWVGIKWRSPRWTGYGAMSDTGAGVETQLRDCRLARESKGI